MRQEKLVFNVDGSKPIDAVPCDVEKQTIHLNCTPDARWRIQETPDWVSIDKQVAPILSSVFTIIWILITGVRGILS